MVPEHQTLLGRRELEKNVGLEKPSAAHDAQKGNCSNVRLDAPCSIPKLQSDSSPLAMHAFQPLSILGDDHLGFASSEMTLYFGFLRVNSGIYLEN